MMTVTMEALPWCLPLIYLLSSLPAFLARPPAAWRIAQAGAAMAVLFAAVTVALAFAQPVGQGRVPGYAGMTMGLLVALLGWVILRYSQRYLQGEAGQQRYLGAMTLALASVATVVVADHLVVLAAAWMASSICVHQLLTFYRDRRAAQIVAHKKFLASRLADLCMALALALVFHGVHTLSLSEVVRSVAEMETLPATLHVAMVLVALAVILKSAQLPVHGWLIQVMEAPTPVSALLHAGIVNLGGFLLIRLAALLSAAPAAQTLLVIVGSLTAVVAGLVMMTRVSIKVRLAWSTCAQMGFMLLECGLGLYELAFLHLIAHSLYKAYAFLTAGEAVLETRRAQMLPATASASGIGLLLGRLGALPVAWALVMLSLAAWQTMAPGLSLQPAVVMIVAIGLAPLLWREDGWTTGLLRGLASVIVLVQLYLAWHIAFGILLPAPAATVSVLLTAWVAACFILLFLAQTWLLSFPEGSFSKRLYPWAYYGFFLDEHFTRLTFKLWPVRLAEPSPPATAAYRFSGEQA